MNKEDYFKYYIQGSDHYLIPKDKVEMVKNICSKYLKYRGKGGYENSRDITINSDIGEKIINWNNENCYCIQKHLHSGNNKHFRQ